MNEIFRCFLTLNHFKNSKNIIVFYLNTNSIRIKFHCDKEPLVNYIDIFIAVIIMINESFPTSQFAIDGFHKPSFFYLGLLSRTFTIHRTAGEGGSYFFKSSLPLPPAPQTLRHEPNDYCREPTSAHS